MKKVFNFFIKKLGHCYECLDDWDCNIDGKNKICSLTHVCENTCNNDQVGNI